MRRFDDAVDGHIWLIGMMGAGKSASGRMLASRLERDFIDTDAEVAARTGCSVAQLWGEQGEAAFRGLEAATVARLTDRDDAVIATGGGVVLDSGNVATMRLSGFVVWLMAEPATLSARVGRPDTRPLLTGDSSPQRLGVILAERASLYAGAAHATVVTEDLSVTGVAQRVEDLWNAS